VTSAAIDASAVEGRRTGLGLGDGQDAHHEGPRWDRSADIGGVSNDAAGRRCAKTPVRCILPAKGGSAHVWVHRGRRERSGLAVSVAA